MARRETSREVTDTPRFAPKTYMHFKPYDQVSNLGYYDTDKWVGSGVPRLEHPYSRCQDEDFPIPKCGNCRSKDILVILVEIGSGGMDIEVVCNSCGKFTSVEIRY